MAATPAILISDFFRRYQPRGWNNDRGTSRVLYRSRAILL